jgi:hypothetical protein
MAAVDLNIGGGSGSTDLNIGASPMLGMLVLRGYPVEVQARFGGSSPFVSISITGYAAELERLAVERSIETAVGYITLSGTPAELGQISYLAPSVLWPSYSFDGTAITISLDDFIGLSSAEADAVTGDWREVLQALLLWNCQFTASLAWSSKPKTFDSFVLNLLNSETFDRHFLIHFIVNMGDPNVAPEP